MVSSALAARDSGAEAPSVANERQPPVYAIYYPWYCTPWGPHKQWRGWDKGEQKGQTAPNGTDAARFIAAAGRRDIASAEYPLIGPYDSNSREVMRWHIRLAQAAGIEAFLVDWWGPGNWQKPPGQTYRAFVECVLPVAEEEGFKICLFDELPQFYKGFAQVKDWAAEYLATFSKSPAYLRVDGKPVYCIYQFWQGKITPAQFVEMKKHVERRAGPVHWMVCRWRCRPNAAFPSKLEMYFPQEWLATPEVDVLTGYSIFGNMRTHDYRELKLLYANAARMAHGSGHKIMLPVHPGHDNGKFYTEPYVMPRLDGATLRAYLRAAAEAPADYVAITSFNEWPESTVVEPSLLWDDPYQYLKIVAEFTGAAWRTPPLPPRKALDPSVIPILEKRGLLERESESEEAK